MKHITSRTSTLFSCRSFSHSSPMGMCSPLAPCCRTVWKSCLHSQTWFVQRYSWITWIWIDSVDWWCDTLLFSQHISTPFTDIISQKLSLPYTTNDHTVSMVQLHMTIGSMQSMSITSPSYWSPLVPVASASTSSQLTPLFFVTATGMSQVIHPQTSILTPFIS